MKNYILVLLSAVLLSACSNNEKQQSVDKVDSAPYFQTNTMPRKDTVAVSDNKEAEKPAAASTVSPKSARSHYSSEHDNMRGFDPASEDDMDDNGMSRYFENDDDTGWD